MLPAGTVVENPRTGGRLEMLEMTPELLRFERLLKPETGYAGPHFHGDFTQTFEVVSGSAKVEVRGETRDLGPGDREEIAIDTPHRDAYNASPEDAVVRFRLEPVPEFVERYVDALVHLTREGKTDDQDELPLVQILVLAHATHGQSFAAGPPVWLQKATLPLIALIGRARGYRAEYPA